MAIKGVLFDFSGTLFRIESVRSWLAAALAGRGVSVDEAAFDRYARELEAARALPGGPAAQRVPEDLAEAWASRDESAEAHRAAYTGLARQVALPDPGLYDALYERHRTPEAWRPYPDAAEVLGALAAGGVRIGVVSNIGWDLRPVFRAHGLDSFVDAYALSFEHGIRKPDAQLFHIACTLLGQHPTDVVMVGDDRHADAGAAALGCEVRFVEPVPLAERPHGLRELGLLPEVA